MSGRWLASAALAALVSATAPQPQRPLRQSPPAPARTLVSVEGSKRWIGRETEYENFIRTARVVRVLDTDVGVTHPKHCLFEPGGLASGIVFKPLPPGKIHGFFESYRSEIAAYELDKLLGMHMVPPTVERHVNGEIGSAQLWVDDVVLLNTKDVSAAPDIAAWNRQVFRQRVFDDLIANIDRNQGNLLLDRVWNLILIDHSRAFASTDQMPFPMTHIDREFYMRLKALDEATVTARLGALLLDGPKALLQRRDRIVAHFDRLISERGEAAVLTN